MMITESVLKPASGGFSMWEAGEEVDTECDDVEEWKGLVLDLHPEAEIREADEISGAIYNQNGRKPFEIRYTEDGEPCYCLIGERE